MRRALVVGIDDYSEALLSGCVNDATRLATLLRRHADDSPNFDVRVLTTPPDDVSRVVLREAIEELFAHEADVALFYFAGHGTETNLDGYIVTADATRYDEGIAMTELLARANDSASREAVILLDSCHSGALGQVPAAGGNLAQLREGVSILTASRSSQSASEAGGGGIFTTLLRAALEGGAADVLGNINAASLYAYVDQSLGPWDQRPLFKAHVARLTPLRRAQPDVPLAILRRLPDWFPDPSAEFALDPSFEPDAQPRNAANEEIFGQLQKCRAAKLVEPVGEEHMYFAAMNSASCRLTALGRHYWRLASDERI
jgi:uncharacterized caspase-like protein